MDKETGAKEELCEMSAYQRRQVIECGCRRRLRRTFFAFRRMRSTIDGAQRTPLGLALTASVGHVRLVRPAVQPAAIKTTSCSPIAHCPIHSPRWWSVSSDDSCSAAPRPAYAQSSRVWAASVDYHHPVRIYRFYSPINCLASTTLEYRASTPSVWMRDEDWESENERISNKLGTQNK